MRCLSAGQAGDQVGGPVDLFLGVVVVGGEPDQLVDAAVFCVQRVVLGHGGGDVDPGAGQGLGCLLSRHLADLGGDDGAAGLSEVVDGDAGQAGELAAEPGSQGDGTLPDLLQAQVEG